VADSIHENQAPAIEGCKRKERKAQEALYKAYFGYALSVALLYSSNRDEAVETVDDSFIKVFAEIGRFNSAQSFKGWLRKIVINTAIDKIRKKNRNKLLHEELSDWIPGNTPGAESSLTAGEIAALIGTLPHIHKTIFCLFDIEGYSHEEISKRLRIPESSSRVYLTRARKRLRELYEFNYNNKPAKS
jgi:RNA polymerase sigma-70 factor (ECF subfamily)